MKRNFRWIDLVLIVCMATGAISFYPFEAKALDLTVGAPPCSYPTINEAISAASAGDRLLIEGGVVFIENIVIDKDLTLQGGYDGCTSGSSEPTTINGGGSAPVIVVNAALTVTLANLNLTNGNSGTEGGGICFARGTGSGTLSLSNVNIYDNTALWGGGLWVGLDAEVIGEGVDIYDNTATIYGGGVRLYGGRAEFTNSNIYDNTAPSGAGIYATLESDFSPELSLLSSADVYGNQALTEGGLGGGIYMSEGAVVVADGSNINENSAIAGGGIYATGSTLNIDISDSVLMGNTATTDGGGIYINAGTLDFTGAWTLRQNAAGVNGGAIAVLGTAQANLIAGAYSLVYFNQALGGHGGMVYLGNNTTMKLYANSGSRMYIYANHAESNGGALYADSGGYFDNYGDVIFDRNRADNGGAIFLSNGSRVWLDDYINIYPQLWDNRADNGSGGAIYAVDSPRVECDGATFGADGDGNQAAVSGGAIYLNNSTFDADNCIFQYNQAAEHGGAIAADNSSSISVLANYISPSLLTARPSELEVLEGPTKMATPGDPGLGPCSAFSNNIADGDADDSGNGGAIYSSSGTLSIAYTYLYNNSAVRGGAVYQDGAAASAEVSNSLIYNNTSGSGLGAGIRTEGGEFTVTHATLANNINGAGYSQSTTNGHATNSIAWGNSHGGFWVTSGTLTGEFNIDQSGNVGANINPRFVDAANGDFRLQNSSPAIDTCSSGLSPDLRNRQRPNGAGYDMGVYEFYAENEVDAVTNPEGCGSVSGTGTYITGSTATVNASAQPGYVFSHWSIENMVVSCTSSYSFEVTDDLTLQANFSQEQSQYSITCSANPVDHGFVSGTGSYSHGANATVIAYPDSGYGFVNWIETWDGFEGSCVVSSDQAYTFTANRDRNLTAILRLKALPGVMLLLLDD